MTVTSPPGPSRRIFLLAQPRTASNLLVRLLGLENQSNVYWDEPKSCPFVDRNHLNTLIPLASKPVDEWTEDEIAEVKKGFQRCFNKLDQYVAVGENDGKVIFAKDHCNLMWRPDVHNHLNDKASKEFEVSLSPRHEFAQEEMPQNPTVLPSQYLVTWRPIFVIRHPALSFASYYRTSLRAHASKDKDMTPLRREALEKHRKTQMSFSFTRSLYDWYLEWSTNQDDTNMVPVLLDADDYINDPEIVRHLARELELDESSVQCSWSPRSYEGADYFLTVWRDTLDSSRGVLKDKMARNLDIGYEYMKWKAEFGESVAHMLLDCVMNAMPDYHYLRSKRFC
ncbi:uncharacterized protein Aud_009643 [Aspergillus udagawae]|uniref:Uncharacterized protein n=1 Tax=Aspergillus udagawae TaxID=91492 RepID=A0A8E0V3Z3_9EURO|nr:uncharacterized protein Aud_009643 [Aspergillus udagawae]GIC93161.1 hypothetical protein Aud_009643 [Aspergillus udagawae]